MAVSGMAKALIQNYMMTYIMKSGQDAFPEAKEEAERKISGMISFVCGIAMFVIPLSMSAIYTQPVSGQLSIF